MKSQLASGAKTLAQMLPGTGAAARWMANQPEPTTGKAPPASVGSVLEHEALPAADLPSRDLPLRPETRQAANNAWDAASPQDRQRLQSLPGWQGQLARERAAQFAQADKGIFAVSPTATLFDTRVEGRTKTLIAKGEHPDFARRAAYEGAAAGVAPGQEVKALGGTVQPSTYDFETKNLLDPNRPANLLNTTVGRGIAKGGLGLGKGVVGIAQLIEDGMGADDATKQRTANRANALRSMEQAIGERGTHLQRNAEGAIASITQQLPMLVAGSFVPSQLLAMGSIAAQSFGQEYSDGKSRGLDPQQAAGRAGAFAAFEVIGEKFGLKGNLDAIRKATQGMPSDAVAGFLANQVKKEIPGEVLTTTGQFAVDKWAPAGMALNPNATFEDYFRQVGDTITQTVMQGGMMSGGRRVLGGVSATAPPAPSAPRVQDQSTTPNPPHAQEATYESGTGSTTAPAPAPSPASTTPATGYDGVPVRGNATWSDVTTATRKAQAEAEILRQAEALPAQESATSTATAPAPAAPPATPPAPMPGLTDGNRSSTQQSADALPQERVSSDAGQAGTNTQASVVPAPAPRPTAADAETNASTTETAPTNLQHGSARHTAAAQIQPPAPIDAQIQALDSGMLVIGGDQATILAHLHAGGVRGAEPFMGTTIVPVDQAALAQQVLGRNGKSAAPTGVVSEPRYSAPDDMQSNLERVSRGDSSALPLRNATYAGNSPQKPASQDHPGYTVHDDRVPSSPARSSGGNRAHAVSPDAAPSVILRGMGDQGVLLRDTRIPDLGAGLDAGDTTNPSHQTAVRPVASRDGLFAHEPTQPDDGYSAGTTYFAGAPAGGSRRGGLGQGDRAAARATLVGLGIAERIAVAGSQALVGERVDSPEHLAELAQVYRDPRYETFRVFFVKDGQVVHATGVSSRLPDRTPMVPSGMTEAQYLAQFREGMRRTGAQGYYILHNHPSGDPQPSPEDLELTEHLARQVPGMLAHVVINSNKYAVITPQDAARRLAPAAMVLVKDFGPDMLLRASKPMAALGQTIPSSDALATVGKSLQKPGWITLVGIGADARVRAIAEAPSRIFARSPAYLAASVRRFSRMSGSAQVFAVGDAGDINNSPVRQAVEAGILRDAVTDLGQSLAEGGRMPARRNDRVHLRDNTESADQRNPEFSNARPALAPIGMEMQRDGTLMVKGDPVQLQERLRQGGVDRVLRRKGGVVVGLDQVHKARKLLQQPPRTQAPTSPSLPPPLAGQQFSRNAPDRASRARGLPSRPATVQSVRAAVAKLTNSMGLLAEGRGRVVVATSADIQAHWEPLVGEVDMGSQDIGLAQGFFDPSTDTVFLIADHIEAGQEMAVAAHELVHKHGKSVLGEARWRQLHEVIGSWANRPEGSLERRVDDEAAARVQASRPDNADAAAYSSEELFPYAVQVAMELGVQPTALMPANSVQGWLVRVRAALRSVFEKLTRQPGLFDSQDLVNLAWGIAQRENPEHVRELDAIWTEVPGDVQAVIDSARQPGHAPQKAVLGGMSEWLAYEAAVQAGLNIAGFTHVIDGSAARHMLNRHTNPSIEKSRGQIALSDADILAAPQVINDPDLVVLGTKTQGHKDQIVYLKRLEDGSILYLEEVRTGRREMAAMSMRKYPAAKDFSAILATLPSNARSDGGNTKQIVLVPPATGKLTEPGGQMFSRQTGVDTPKITKSGPKPDDSILVDGSPDMWTVPAQVEKATKGMFPSAPVRLKNGFHRRTNQGYGVAHIEAEHAVEISALGLTVPQYVQRILGGATKVYDPGNGRLYIVNERFAGKHQAIIELRDDGDHYSVVTAFARRPEGKVVWSGRSSSAGLPSANAPLATGKTESFDSTPAFGSSADPSAYRDNGEPQIETPKPSPSSRIAGQTDESLPEGG
ncbi:MAG: JAB domain-containing protein [Acidovorax sp.]